MKEKVFKKAIIELVHSASNVKTLLNDKRLSAIERTILEGHLKIRKNQSIYVIENQVLHHPIISQFVESQRLQLLGSAFNNLSSFQEAETSLKKAIDISRNLQDPFFIFIHLSTLFHVYENTAQLDKMLSCLKEMQILELSSIQQQLKLLRCEFCYYQASDNLQEADRVFSALELRKNDFSEWDYNSFLVNKYMFLVRKDDINAAFNVLEEMKASRNYSLSENFQYIKIMTTSYLKRSAMYVYEKDFINTPYLYHQLKTVQSLEADNTVEAKFHWQKLAEIYPGVYDDNFRFNGGKCIFSLFLERILSERGRSEVVLSSDSKIERLIELLEKSNHPLNSSMIHEVIWGEPPADKESMVRLSRLIYKAKLKGYEIRYKKNTYELIKIKKAS